ncbi:MAG: methylated-DNA--[protein]-cysteine S-methyltransferase [Ignavibacteriales bacterium]|nr:methylated-DNA--[protein]-cysteine S-methyltransferase [Ignavibacteriales bacterium]
MVSENLVTTEIAPISILIRKKMKAEDRQFESASSVRTITKIYCTSFDSRIGKIYVASTENGVCKISLPKENRKDFINWIDEHISLDAVVDNRSRNKEVIDQLNRYFNGKLAKFNLQLDMLGTPFQVRVWKELVKIEYGTTITYKQLAKRVKTPQAFQAVGRANACNPLPVIIPCHRVLGAGGSLVGYASGIKTKEFLLRLEGAIML